MNQAEIDRQTIEFIVNQTPSEEEARQRLDKLQVSLKKDYYEFLVEEAIKNKFLIINKTKEIQAKILNLESKLK
jgi:hypothetical protein